MPWLELLLINSFVTFTLVLSRVSGLVMTAPIFGSQEVPARVRALFSFALAVLLTPTQLKAPVSYPANLVEYGLLVAAEIVIGLALGTGLMILFSGIQVAGQVIGQMSGMSLADVFNPGFDTEVPLFSQLLYYVALAVFVIIGGHRKVMDALLGTFSSIPCGGGAIPSSLAETMVALVSQSFVLGMRAAAPAMVALLLATVVMGLVSRALPQLNILSVGFGVSSLVTLVVLAMSLGSMVWIFQHAIDPSLELMLESLTSS